jgi:hypothetical protein
VAGDFARVTCWPPDNIGVNLPDVDDALLAGFRRA